MRAAGGQRPLGDAGCGLLDLPVRGLLGPVMGPAPRGKVALVGGSVRPGHGVVKVRVDRLGLAAGSVASRGAGTDQVPEPTAGGVVRFSLGVVAGASCDGGEGDAEAVQKLNELGGRRLGFQVVEQLGVLAVSATVREGPAVGSSEGDAPAGTGVTGGGLGDGAGLAGVEQAPGAGLSGRRGPAKEGAGRDDEVDEGGQRTPAGARGSVTGLATGREGHLVGVVVCGVAAIGTPASPGVRIRS